MRACDRLVAFALAILALSAVPSAAKVPSTFTIQGLLRDGQGKLQTMPVTVVINVFDANQMGNLLAGPYTQMVKADNGLFTVEVTDANLRSLLAPASQVWIEVTVGNDTFPRRQVTAEIFALMAGSAEMADKLSPACSGCVDDSMIAAVTGNKVTGKVPACTNADLAVSFSGNLAGDVTGTQSATKVTGLMGIPIMPQPPMDQQVLKYDSSNKAWIPGSDGTVTNVATGAGLAGGPITTTGTISIAQNGIVPSMVSMGTYGISVAGNAGTVTNGLYSSGTYADPAWLKSLSGTKITGPVATALSATNFTGLLSGDVTGTQTATVVSALNGSPLGNLGGATAGQVLTFDGAKWAAAPAPATTKAVGQLTLNTPLVAGSTADTTIVVGFQARYVQLNGQISICDNGGSCRTTLFVKNWSGTTSMGGISMTGNGSGRITQQALILALWDPNSPQVTSPSSNSTLTLSVASITPTTVVFRLTNAIVLNGGSTDTQICNITYSIDR